MSVRGGISMSEARRMIAGITGCIIETLADGDDVAVLEFGRFCTRRLSAAAWDPQARGMKVRNRSAVRFRASRKILK
jgi:nucleoid DNA-binding protein